MAVLSENIPKAIDFINALRLLLSNEGAIEEFTVPEGIKTIGRGAFYSSYRVKKIIFSSTVTTTQMNSFYSSAIEECVINSGFKTLAMQTFARSSSLRKVNLPKSITSVGNFAFANCPALEDVTIESGFDADRLDFSASTLFPAEMIAGWLNALADRTGKTAYTLTIGAANLAKLTDAQKAVATAKNWTLA